jgi:hypothetical protein
LKISNEKSYYWWFFVSVGIAAFILLTFLVVYIVIELIGLVDIIKESQCIVMSKCIPKCNQLSPCLRWPTLVRSIPGQIKIKGGTLCVWNRKFLFLLWKVLIHEKSLLERIFISKFSSVNKFSICNEIFKFTTSHGIINSSAYLCFDHFYTQAISFVTSKVMHNTEYSLHKIIPDLHISVCVSYYESLHRKKV